MEYQDAKQQELQRIMDYQEVFGHPKGPRVLKDLQDRFLYRLMSVHHAEAGNGVGLSYIAGQRELMINLHNWISCDAQEWVDKRYPNQEEEPNAGQSESKPSLAEWSTGDE